MSLKKNILVLLKVNASVSTEPAWKRLRRRMDFPSDGYRAGRLPATPLAMQMCPPLGVWHLSPCFGRGGVLTWDYRLALIQEILCQLLRELAEWPFLGRMRYTNLTFACQTSGVLSAAWPCTRSSFCTTTYEFSKEEKHSDYELSRRKKVLQINDKETRTMHKKVPGRENATRSLVPVNKFYSERGSGF